MPILENITKDHVKTLSEVLGKNNQGDLMLTTVSLIKLKCHCTEDYTGADEVQLKLDIADLFSHIDEAQRSVLKEVAGGLGLAGNVIARPEDLPNPLILHNKSMNDGDTKQLNSTLVVLPGRTFRLILKDLDNPDWYDYHDTLGNKSIRVRDGVSRGSLHYKRYGAHYELVYEVNRYSIPSQFDGSGSGSGSEEDGLQVDILGDDVTGVLGRVGGGLGLLDDVPVILPLPGGGADTTRPDTDGDNVPDAEDVCPTVPDPLQSDLDEDGIGDLCDSHPLDPNKG